MSTLTFEKRDIDELKPSAHNARKHSKDQIRQLKKSMKQFSFMNPIITDTDGNIIAGHARYQAAKELGYTELPCLQANHLSEDDLRAYMLADNKIAENATWDNDLLRVELEFFTKLDLDIETTGFSITEADIILGHAEQSPSETVAASLLTPSAKPVTQLGDVCALGPHRIACGDVRDNQLLADLMGSDVAQMVFVDPPYNVKIDGHVSGLGAIKHQEFAMASGEMTDEEFELFLKTCLLAIKAISDAGALHYICMDWRHILHLLNVGQEVYHNLVNLCVWKKTNAGMGSLYRSQHELVVIFKTSDAPHLNNVQLGKDGRYRTNVWEYAGVNTFSPDRDELLSFHPTVKPTQMVADAILDVTRPGDLIFDGFLGSGTTLLAAEQVGRRCYATEIDPRYVDVALKRWLDLTGEQPIYCSTGQTFNERASEEVSDVG